MSILERRAPELSQSTARHLAALVDRRQFSTAVDFFERHKDDIDEQRNANSLDAAVAYHSAARAYASLAENQKALMNGRIAEAVASNCGEPKLLAEIFLTLGGVLHSMNEMKAARKAYQDAESLFRRQGSLDGQCRALNLLAGLSYHKKDFRNALSILMDALEIAHQLNDRKKLAFMMGNIGRIQLFTGDLVQAEKNLKINLELSSELEDSLEVARADLSLGYLYIQMEDFIRAESTLAAALPLIERANSKQDEVTYHTYQGELCYRRGEFESSFAALKCALSMAEGIAPGATQVGTVHRHLAELHVRMGKFRIARRHISQGMVIMRSADDPVELGALYKLSSLVSADYGSEESGRDQMQKALDLLGESGVRWEKAEALVAAGRSLLFSRRQRMTYLFRAEEFYTRAHMNARLSQIGRYIREIEMANQDTAVSPTMNNPKESSLDFVSECDEIIRFKRQLPKLGLANLPILLTGETGVGKDHMARYYHSLARPSGPFIAINCASVPDTLLESELFGYHKGAFTGAEKDKAGLFVAANCGVLFLDEIGDMPITLQTKLLGVLERRKVTPLGSTVESDLDILLVAATNCDLEQMVEQGRFRRDLYYRLSGITFYIPPLRERKGDIVLLVERFLKKRGLLDKDAIIPSELLRQFLAYEWPGNVRELDNRIRRLEIMNALAVEGDIVEMSLSLFGSPEDIASESSNLFERVEQFERDLITEAILAAGGNKSKAARMLGVHEATVRTKVKRYGISVGGGDIN